MTKQESFKRRVRERMEKTGERYGAARRALLGGLADTTQTSAPEADGRVMVNVSHDELPDAAAVVHWKQYWSDWLVAIDEA